MVSVDTPEDNKAFAEKEHADFPILADPGKKIATAYGVVNDQRPLAYRWTFYIGPDGKITYIDKQVKPATSGEDVLAKLKERNVPERRKIGRSLPLMLSAAGWRLLALHSAPRDPVPLVPSSARAVWSAPGGGLRPPPRAAS